LIGLMPFQGFLFWRGVTNELIIQHSTVSKKRYRR
jgi:hypothetical protein